MEEKKEITIKFTTLLIIILILVIIGLVAYIMYNPKIKEVSTNNVENEELENNVKDTESNIIKENEIVEQSTNLGNEVVKEENEQKEEIVDNNKSEKEETSSLKGEKFIQFDNNFYELKDVAKEYRLSENIKNYKDFNYDLDGDRIKEKITIQKNKDSDENSYIFKLNGKIFTERYNRSEIYIVDLNEKDNDIEVVIYDDGPSDDPNYTIYSKKGNKMVDQKNISGWPLLTDKKGIILVGDCYNGSTSPKVFFNYYKINEGKFVTEYIDINKVKNIDFSTSLCFSEKYSNKDKFWDAPWEDYKKRFKEVNIEELDKNTTFKILKFETVRNDEGDIEDYKIYVQLSDGRKGYIFHIQLAG